MFDHPTVGMGVANCCFTSPGSRRRLIKTFMPQQSGEARHWIGRGTAVRAVGIVFQMLLADAALAERYANNIQRFGVKV